MIALQADPHRHCWLGEPCELGDPMHCRLEPIRRARAQLQQGQWSPLKIVQESGGLRHYLDGKPVHCGMGLELQHTEERSDDYGEFTAPLQEGAVVRYEATWAGELTATAHVLVGGHEFVTRVEPWMRFRWPKKGGGR